MCEVSIHQRNKLPLFSHHRFRFLFFSSLFLSVTLCRTANGFCSNAWLVCSCTRALTSHQFYFHLGLRHRRLFLFCLLTAFAIGYLTGTVGIVSASRLYSWHKAQL